MKNRFNTFDIVCTIAELQKLIGLRVNQIYDIDNKTYLIRLQQSEVKHVLLLESGTRFHTTGFEWPKNVAPSGFTMKLRKHLKNKRLEKLQQYGIDRIVGLQFGSGEAAYHVILELYDRGNIILTDHEMTILNILRPHVEGEEVRFAVREKYPVSRAKQYAGLVSEEQVREAIQNAKQGDNLRRILTPILDCGPSVLEHVLVKHDLADCKLPGNENQEENPQQEEQQGKGKKNRKQKKGGNQSSNARLFDIASDLPKLMCALKEADEILQEAKQEQPKGYITQKREEKPSEKEGDEQYFYHNIEYNPRLFEQNKNQPFKEFDSFVVAVDEFYSTLEGQKIDLKAMHQEREALKKLSNVKKDHEKRLEDLNKIQLVDKQKAELITRNQALVDNAILAIRTALANQMSWPDIHDLVKAAQANNDLVAKSIKQLKLNINNIALELHDPFKDFEVNEESDDEESDKLPSQVVDVDLALSAFANARKYYDQKRTAARKEQRTIDASEKALKSAEKKTQQTLKEVRTITSISKARKVYWFEKFYWFISSENYLVIGGRDSQQNELIVKRYMRPTDIYVHAEIQGASSVVIRNPSGGEVPPKTLLEAGTMAISYSVAWDAKVVTNAYWVKSEQVSKTAPTGEYLGTGSFMIRGKKNFLPPCHLIMGLSLLFKLEESSIERHKGERRVRTFEDDLAGKVDEVSIESDKAESVQEEEIDLNDSDTEEKAEEIEKKPENEQTASNTSDSDEEDSAQFPDTHIKIEHETGKNLLATEPKMQIIEPILQKQMSETNEDEKVYVIPALPTRKKQQQSGKKKKEEKQRKKSESERKEELREIENKKQGPQVKRGQRGKLKKIKEKYKDQDEEERQMRMEILKSAGRKDKKEALNDEEDEIQKKKNAKRQFEQKKQQEDAEELDDLPANADVDMLDSLTGCPVDEDELLFAIPIVAPYQSLQNNKYKVKLTPGTGKRGKAAKMALLMFSKDKSCSAREKDLLKGIKDEALARNIPGKVKLSAPQLQKYKK